jgi:ADP-ribose pyrophosphatase YjhB (NUDIX family)
VVTSVYVEDADDRVLLIHRTDDDLSALRGGGMDVGDGVSVRCRETGEETGIDVEVTSLVGILTNPAHVVAYPHGEVPQQVSIRPEHERSAAKPERVTSHASSDGCRAQNLTDSTFIRTHAAELITQCAAIQRLRLSLDRP